MKLVPLGDVDAAVCVDGVCEVPGASQPGREPEENGKARESGNAREMRVEQNG